MANITLAVTANIETLTYGVSPDRHHLVNLTVTVGGITSRATTNLLPLDNSLFEFGPDDFEGGEEDPLFILSKAHPQQFRSALADAISRFCHSFLETSRTIAPAP